MRLTITQYLELRKLTNLPSITSQGINQAILRANKKGKPPRIKGVSKSFRDKDGKHLLAPTRIFLSNFDKETVTRIKFHY